MKAGFRVDLESSILISDLSFQQQEKFDDMACKACGFVAQTWKQLQLHLMDHTNERPFKCDVCSKGDSITYFKALLVRNP